MWGERLIFGLRAIYVVYGDYMWGKRLSCVVRGLYVG